MLVGGDDGIVLVNIALHEGRHGAGGDPDRAGVEPLHPGPEGLGGLGRGGVVFQIAYRLHPFRISQEKAIAFGVLLALGQDAVGVGQDGAEEPPEALVAGPGTVGDAAIEDDEAGATALGFAPEVGPDFGLEDDDGEGVEVAEGEADGPAKVDGGVKDVVGECAEALFGDGAAGEGGDGDVDGDAGEGDLQLANHFDAGKDFADGDGMQPKATALRPPKGELAEALGEMLGVLAVSHDPA